MSVKITVGIRLNFEQKISSRRSVKNVFGLFWVYDHVSSPAGWYKDKPASRRIFSVVLPLCSTNITVPQRPNLPVSASKRRLLGTVKVILQKRNICKTRKVASYLIFGRIPLSILNLSSVRTETRLQVNYLLSQS